MTDLQSNVKDWHYVRIVSTGDYVSKTFDHTPHIHESRVFESYEEAATFLRNGVSAKFRHDFTIVSQKENKIFDCIEL